jgi:hypothetical protein
MERFLKKPELGVFIDHGPKAPVVFYMGHGSFDQIADEGLLYLEDVPFWPTVTGCLRVRLLRRGMFQFPGRKCMSGEVTLTTAGERWHPWEPRENLGSKQRPSQQLIPSSYADFDCPGRRPAGKIQKGRSKSTMRFSATGASPWPCPTAESP